MYITLFVGNFPFETPPSELMDVFAKFGRVESIKLINDRVTGRPRGFGFIKIERAAGPKAIAALHRSVFSGRPLNVREAGPLRREITLTEAPELRAPSSGCQPDLFVQDYWLHNEKQIPSRYKRSNSSSNY
ncbi:MAG: RNA-binding protein [Deltaproteobacteria bacterium]|jgi:RNA recognition motif-containing protein|nr:RNA-binding protein [Deltaproteobacteria bacterium]